MDYTTLINITGKIVGRKWENAMTIDKHSWGYRRNSRALDVYTIQDLIKQLVHTVSFGGRYTIKLIITGL